MKEEFVTYELAVKLKEKGFNEPCLASYRWGKFMPHKKEILGESEYIDEDISISYKSLLRDGKESLGIIAPTISQVLKWLREEKKLFVEPSLFKYGYESYVQSTIFEEDKDYTDTWRVEGFHSTYEQAALAGIEYVIDNLI